MTEKTRRTQVRDAIASGRLPAGLPATSWAGYGSGSVCSVCDKPIDADQLETEFEDRAGSGRWHYLHLECLAVWEAVVAEKRRAADTALQPRVNGGYSPPGEFHAEKGPDG